MQQRFPSRCKAGMLRFIALIPRPPFLCVFFFFFLQCSFGTTQFIYVPDSRDEEIKKKFDATLNNRGDMRTDFITILKKTKTSFPLSLTQKSLRVERGTPHPSFWLHNGRSGLYLRHCCRSHSDVTSSLSCCCPLPPSSPQTQCQALGDMSFCWRGKYKWKKKKMLENSFRGTILKSRDAEEMENVWPWGRLEVNCFYRL